MTNEYVAFNVDGICDDLLADVIRKALLRLNGVEDVMVDPVMKRVAVEFDGEKMQMETLKGTIEDVGCKVR